MKQLSNYLNESTNSQVFESSGKDQIEIGAGNLRYMVVRANNYIASSFNYSFGFDGAPYVLLSMEDIMNQDIRNKYFWSLTDEDAEKIKTLSVGAVYHYKRTEITDKVERRKYDAMLYGADGYKKNTIYCNTNCDFIRIK